MKLSVIMATYNTPVWLEKVLWGFSVQTHDDFEIIIGDDGSTAETAELISRMKKATGMDIRHVWQSDKGFRKCRVLNKAILHAQSEYLVFTDGDCIPRRDFLEVHAREAGPGRYLSGGYHRLPMSTSKAISKEDILNGCCFSLDWLISHGLGRSFKNLKLVASYGQAGIFNRITPTRCTFKGSNSSAWLKDILNVNGFDERMPYGGLDRELGVRLINSGVRPKHVRYNAIVIHLDHSRQYSNPAAIAANKALRVSNARRKVCRTEYGIHRLIAYGYRPSVDGMALKFMEQN
jgi:glycosyltransferase involved in cell wall biosynthesis